VPKRGSPVFWRAQKLEKKVAKVASKARPSFSCETFFQKSEKGDFFQDAVEFDHRMTKIYLSLTGSLTQRHENFFGRLFNLADSVLDDGVAAGESFGLQNLPDPLGRMTLLPGNAFVGFKDILNTVQIGTHLGFGNRPGSLIARRLAMIPDFAKGLTVNARVPLQLTQRHLFIDACVKSISSCGVVLR